LHFISPVPYGSQMAGSMAAAIGGPATRLILRNAGHLAWLEQPQSVLPALASFFDLPRTTQTQLNGEQS
jgi:pimeloyl-ACP methyl ester carboxylesterase